MLAQDPLQRLKHENSHLRDVVGRLEHENEYLAQELVGSKVHLREEMNRVSACCTIPPVYDAINQCACLSCSWKRRLTL